MSEVDRLSDIERCQVIASHGASCIREAGHDGPHSTAVGSRWHESEIGSLRQQLRGAVEDFREIDRLLVQATIELPSERAVTVERAIAIARGHLGGQ